MKHGFAATLLYLSLSPVVQAGMYEDDMDFSLQVSSSTTDWHYKTGVRETRVKQITARWSQPLASSLYGGLSLSYLDISQADRPQSVGLSSTGGALGIDLQQRIVDTDLIQFSLHLGYDYASVDNSFENQQIKTEWSTSRVGLNIALAPRRPVHFVAGAALVSIDGEELLSGSLNQLTTFSEEDDVDYFVGLNFLTDHSGQIGLRWNGGTHEGVVLQFSRRY